jgi:hypothetical protein
MTDVTADDRIKRESQKCDYDKLHEKTKNQPSVCISKV